MKNTRSKTYTNSEFVFLDMDYATAFKRFSSMAGPCHINNSQREQLYFICSKNGVLKTTSEFIGRRHRVYCFDYVEAELTDDYGKAKLEICDVHDRSEILSFRIWSIFTIIFTLIYCAIMFLGIKFFSMQTILPFLAMLAASVYLFVKGETLAKSGSISDLDLMRKELKNKIELVQNEKLWSENL